MIRSEVKDTGVLEKQIGKLCKDRRLLVQNLRKNKQNPNKTKKSQNQPTKQNPKQNNKPSQTYKQNTKTKILCQ